ncbi:MAG: 1-acyl-sn-glycerol-3-phosphate acyltransferase [Rhodobacterales bacterium]
MSATVEMPFWLLILILLFAGVTFASHFLFPSVRWFFRKRAERVIAQLNTRLERPIQPFKLATRYDMIQRLIYDPTVLRAIAAHATSEGVPENVAFEQARRYAREIVPSFSASAYFGVATRLAKLISTSIYRVRLGQYAGDALAQVDREATVVFVINHRSNMDYVLVTYLAAERSALSYAVGEWGRIWPLSALIRAMGAYFIRRKRFGPLYKAVLSRYVQLATEAGVTQAVFPEGGLSLSGGIMPPKRGILKYIVDGYDPDGRDVVFVPVAVNYDRVLEDRVLLAAQTAGGRRFVARFRTVVGFVTKLFVLRLKGKFHRFGYAAVSFGEPLSLNGFQGDVPALASELMRRVAAEVPVLPVPLVAAAILKADAPLNRAELEAAAQNLVGDLPQAHLHMPRQDTGYLVEAGLRLLLQRHLVQERDGMLRLVPAQRSVVEYYAASIAHLFRTRSE